MVATDQEHKKILVADLVPAETEQWATNTLQFLKSVYLLLPLLVVCDLASGLIAAIIAVFGEEVLGIDGFHVMQAVNRAIRKDLVKYRKVHFDAEFKAINSLRDWIQAYQDRSKQKVGYAQPPIPPIPRINAQFRLASLCFSVIQQCLTVLSTATAQTFHQLFSSFITVWTTEQESCVHDLIILLQTELNHFGSKETGFIRFQTWLFQKLKKMCRDARQPLDDASAIFYRRMWLLFKQPEHLQAKQQVKLTEFLKQYPDLSSYRVLTLRLGSIYRLPSEKITPHIIDGIEIQAGWGDELKSVLGTVKKYRDAILRFKTVFLAHPDLPKCARASTEYKNRNVKKALMAGWNRLSLSHIKNRLVYQIGGVVRDYLTTNVAPQSLNTAVIV